MKPPPYAAGSELDHFAGFCRDHLIQSTDRWDGKPLELYRDQRRLLNEALAYDDAGLAIWQAVIVQAPRKTGKTHLLAAYALYRLLTASGSPEILLAASSDKQAGRLFDACAAFVRRSPALSKLCRARDYVGEIPREDGRGMIRRMAADPRRLYGYSPTLVVLDELAWWTTPELERAFAALTSGGGARTAPQVFAISTAGDSRTRHSSIMGRLLDAAEAAEDAQREPGLLVARQPDAKMLVWAYSAPTTDPRDIDAMLKANRAPWITRAYLERQAATPELSDADVLRLHGCVWSESEDAWLPAGAWEACADPREVEPGGKVVLGFDGSYRRDATALMGATVEERPHVFVVRVWERPPGAPDDWKIDRHAVDAELARAMERYDVAELAADPPGWASELEMWQDAYGDVVVEFPTAQVARMAPACDRFRAAAIEATLSHDGDPTLARHVANCVVREGRSGTTIGKAEEARKIDAAVAATIAYERASWHGNQPEAVPMVAWGS